MQDLVKLIQEQQGSAGIVYAHTRKTCDWLAAKLGNAGVDAAAYHAGKDAGERSRAQEQWMEGAYDCVVATVAFGMVYDPSWPLSCRFLCLLPVQNFPHIISLMVYRQMTICSWSLRAIGRCAGSGQG